MACLDPIQLATQAEGKQRLGDMRDMTAAYGLVVECTPLNYLGKNRDGVVCAARSCCIGTCWNRHWTIGWRRPAFAALVWTRRSDGRSKCVLADEIIEIGQTILAYDSAILSHLSETMWPALLQRQVASSILTTPGALLAAPVIYPLNSGIMLNQRPGLGVMAYGIEHDGSVVRATGRHPRQAKILAACRLILLSAPDHQRWRADPRTGPAGTGPDVLAGFGMIGAFMASAIARWLSGKDSEAENAWFGACLLDRNGNDGPVSDIG
ncbi:MAG: hypothetical protein MO846_01265 [Candidatus Devosia symbiotica]|nr:hypothetical protein [Candidatus Devosia symbiotica]